MNRLKRVLELLFGDLAGFRNGFSFGIILGSHVVAVCLIAFATFHRDDAIALFLLMALLGFWAGRVTKGSP